MSGDFDYKGYKIVISRYSVSQSDQKQTEKRFDQRITIIGLDKQVDLFLQNSTYSEAKTEVMTRIDSNSL